jgi:hypothetical protein
MVCPLRDAEKMKITEKGESIHAKEAPPFDASFEIYQ